MSGDWHKTLSSLSQDSPKVQELQELMGSLPTEQIEKFQTILQKSPLADLDNTKTSEDLKRECLEELIHGRTKPLYDAILQNKLPIDTVDHTGQTLLHHAIYRNEYDMVLSLLDEVAAPIDLKNSNGMTPLSTAAFSGNIRMLKLLLDRGADIEAQDSYQLTPFLNAIQGRQLDVAILLYHRGANIYCKDINGCNAVHWASYKNDVQMLRWLLTLKFELTGTDDSGQTPLHRACSANAMDATYFLLRNGCPYNALDNLNRDPFVVAINSHAKGSV